MHKSCAQPSRSNTDDGGFRLSGPGARTWRPRPGLIGLGVCAAIAAVAWVVLTDSPMDLVVGAVIAIVIAVLSVVGWRRRLVGGPRGLLICGVGGSRIVPWSQVRTMDSTTSSRFGLASTTIEIDLVDDALLVFGRIDLGADPVEVLAALREWLPPAQRS